MSTEPEHTLSGRQKRTAYGRSKDGKWRSFSHVPHLLQYVSSRSYFAIIKVGGKIIRESLETEVWPAAPLRLLDLLGAQAVGTAVVELALYTNTGEINT